MVEMMNNKVVWFTDVKRFRGINWEELSYPCEETVHFEPNGDGVSKYIWAHRKSDNRLMRVGKYIKNYAVLPFLFGFSELLTGLALLYRFLNSNSTGVEFFCLYGILFLIFSYYLLDDKREENSVS